MNNIKLIADAGGTKTQWAIIREKKTKKVLTDGISPYFQNTEQILELLQQQLLRKIGKDKIVGEIYYYGSGCMNRTNNKIVYTALHHLFSKAKIYIKDDVFGAARALCGDKKGIACILGTGSSACLFDGKKIIEDRTGMGFILGDEGSGAFLGKKVLQYFLYKKFDKELTRKFKEAYNTNEEEILDNVYKKELPNKYLASFSCFLSNNRGHKLVEEILEEGINAFFMDSILLLKNNTYPVNFVGGIAIHFRDILEKLCLINKLSIGTILKEPIDGLISYHKSNN